MKIYIILYSLILILLTIYSYIFVDSNLIYLKRFYTSFTIEHGLLISLIFLFFILANYFFYFLFILKFKKKKIDLTKLKYLLLITSGILLFSYPAMLSYDIFNYIATSKVLYFYHENPYLVMPIEFTGDPLLLFMHAGNKTALYGPFWITLTGIPFLLGFGQFLITLFNFKLFIIPFYFGTNILIYKLSKNLFPLLLFALNPLVVIETLISGHNDIAMIFLALLSFYLLKKKLLMWSLLFFALSILIKYATIFLIPVYLYLLIKHFQNIEIDWDKIFFFSFFCMITIFLLSFIREEIYPWYAIWFLPFSFLSYRRKIIYSVSLVFSFSLLLRYIPFFVFGTYFGVTPILKSIFTFVPVVILLCYFLTAKLIRKKI